MECVAKVNITRNADMLSAGVKVENIELAFRHCCGEDGVGAGCRCSVEANGYDPRERS